MKNLNVIGCKLRMSNMAPMSVVVLVIDMPISPNSCGTPRAPADFESLTTSGNGCTSVWLLRAEEELAFFLFNMAKPLLMNSSKRDSFNTGTEAKPHGFTIADAGTWATLLSVGKLLDKRALNAICMKTQATKAFAISRICDLILISVIIFTMGFKLNEYELLRMHFGKLL